MNSTPLPDAISPKLICWVSVSLYRMSEADGLWAIPLVSARAPQELMEDPALSRLASHETRLALGACARWRESRILLDPQASEPWSGLDAQALREEGIELGWMGQEEPIASLSRFAREPAARLAPASAALGAIESRSLAKMLSSERLSLLIPQPPVLLGRGNGIWPFLEEGGFDGVPARIQAALDHASLGRAISAPVGARKKSLGL